ncbi:SusC/RagA family TonB-linked outer membrane protein [Prevotella sp. AM42-24]|uniref:SusC/RagA family TonB-linked outer membrane protein n=1 Tax=Prevotella sp. AM42-24 TaxID=2293125 RepID=UPI000E50750D|nr:SusC/RagA family TonB-linked outer membrane protein [Prevotella sp. AM42-24]RGH45362.1 SusC/RagA family TonB-linked outer membrane protein [Prevotella sp. AM42-24]
MNNIRTYITVGALCSAMTISAQDHRISGTVSDEFGPVIGCNVIEKDANNRNVNATITDVNGNFQLAIKNPKNKLVVSYVGYKTFSQVIGSQTNFQVQLKDANELGTVTVTAKQRFRGDGLSIPKDEVSVATQTMNMDIVDGLAFTSADEALQGQIAGLDIVANSGNLGAGTTMRMRGVTTINGSSEPLIVVNGNIMDVPDAKDTDWSTATEETYSSLLSINVNDIESIDIMKDAAATAIWGARGANGVISIKTKRGKRGKIRIDYNFSLQGNWQPKGYNLLSGDEYTMLMKEELYNPTQNPSATTNINELNYNKSWAEYNNWNDNTDWVKAVTQTGWNQSHGLTISGGGEKAVFRISANYDHQTGTIIKQVLNRFSTRLNLEYYVSDKLKFTTEFPLTYTKNQKSYANILGKALSMAPNMSIYREDGNGIDTNEYYIMLPSAEKDEYGSSVSGTSSLQLKSVRDIGNPVAIANLAWNNESTYRITPDFRINYYFLGNDDHKTRLDYEGQVYLDIFSKSNPTYCPGSLSTNGWKDNSYNLYTMDDYNSFQFQTRHQLIFTPKFKNEDIAWMMLGRWELTSGTSYGQNVSERKLPLGAQSPTLPAEISNMSTSNGEWRSMAGVFSTHLSYKGRYNADFTVRADGTTRFGDNNKWGYFPGMSVRWNISDEPWMKWSRKVLSMLAFRPSWGVNGRTPSSEYLQYAKYAAGSQYGNGNTLLPSTRVDGLQLSDLKWEKTTSWNMGANLGLFDDMIEADFNYYYKKTKDLLNPGVAISSQTGYTTLAWKNIGSMENKGWEFNITAKKFIKAGKFSMDASFNIAQNFNKITEMDQTVLDGINEDWSADSRGKYFKRIQVGNALGSIFGLRHKGVYQYSYDYLENLRRQGYVMEGNEKIMIRDNNDLVDYLNNRFLPSGKTAPIALNRDGKVITGADGKPLRMTYNSKDGGETYKFDGGDVIYEDVNHDGTINSLDMVYLGNSNPKFSGGFGFTFRYGNWSLRTNFVYRTGFKVVNFARMGVEKMYDTTNQSTAVNWRWRKNGDMTEIPRALYNYGYNWLGSDRYVEDASFLRFSYVSLSYDVPKKFLKSVGLNTLRFDLSGQNIFVWSKYSGTDPEHANNGWNFASDSSQTPRSKSFTLRMRIGI